MGPHSSKASFLSTQICCGGSTSQSEELRLAPTSQLPGVFSISTSASVRSPSSAVLDPANEERLERLKEAVHYAKFLLLRVISSKTMASDTQITISAMGVEEGSRREVRDGVVYFGNRRKGRKGGEVVNDVKIPATDAELAEKHRGRHFQIAYDPFSEKYYIRDLSVGFGAFVKLGTPLVLKDNHLLHIGESFVVANLVQEDSKVKLRLKLYGGPCTGEVFYFEPEEYCGKVIHVGRMANSEIQIEDSLISKCQCTIKFDPSQGWVLSDGDLRSGRKSTNGTWLYLSENVELMDGTVFKAEQTVFAVALL